jgi:hypothetical protein
LLISQHLKKTGSIQKLIAFLLLVAFFISTVPKLYIHNILANHKDYENACTHKSHKAPCLKTAGINCHFNDLVVNLPYLHQPVEPLSCTQIYFGELMKVRPSTVLWISLLSSESRGPPTV